MLALSSIFFLYTVFHVLHGLSHSFVVAVKYTPPFLQHVNNVTLFSHPFRIVHNANIMPDTRGTHLARAFVVESWWADSRKMAAQHICKNFSTCVIVPGIFGKELTTKTLDMLVDNGILRADGWLYSKLEGRAKLGSIGSSLTYMLLLDLWNRGNLPGGPIADGGSIVIIEDDFKIGDVDFQALTNRNLASLPARWQMFQIYNKDCKCKIPGYLKPVPALMDVYKIGTRWRVGSCVVFARRFAVGAAVVFNRDGARSISNSFPIDDVIDSHFASLLRGVGGLQVYTSCSKSWKVSVDESQSVRQLIDSP